MSSLFSDFLSVLNVKHTEEYSDARFATMPFPTLFGLSELLKEYGIGSIGLNVAKETREKALNEFPKPFLADTEDGFLIIEKINDSNLTYLSQHKEFTAPVSEVAEAWNGIALLAEKDEESIEPDYEKHWIAEKAQGVKSWILRLLIAALFGFAIWCSGLWTHWAAWLLAIFDMAGITLSFLLVQKALGIQNKAADAVCSVLEEGGCDQLSRSDASSFMGIFKWSEVGLSYFSVSLLAMFLFPSILPVLAAINIVCLPYTVWSIWYQRFRAKTWCTLCVSVQCTLWVLFALYMIGGWTFQIFPMDLWFWIKAIVLAACYLAVMLGINKIDNDILKHFRIKNDENAQSTSD